MAMLTKPPTSSCISRDAQSVLSWRKPIAHSIRLYLSFSFHLSTNCVINITFRCDRRGRRGEDEAEFLQSVNFGDNANGERSNSSDRNQPPHPHSFSPAPSPPSILS